MSEIRRAGIRIASNYVRLFASICLGLILVRWQLRTLGSDAFGLIALLTSSAGIVTIVEEIVGWSMIRELGSAHHSGERDRFLNIYNSAVVVCAFAAVVAMAGFALIFLIVPFLNIQGELVDAARWFVIAKGVESAVIVLLAPQFNMYLALERMAAYNAWLIVKRSTQVIAVASLFWLQPPDEPTGLIWFGWISAALHIGVMMIAALMMTLSDRRLVPVFSSASRRGVRAILGISGWNVAILGSQVMGLPAGQFVMNFAFGLTGNAVFGMAQQLGGYARMVGSGMTGGLDAVAARLSSRTDETGAQTMQRLVNYSTQLHAVVAFPAALVLGLLAYPLMHLWVGREYPPGASELHQASVLTSILVVAFVVMCLGDNWMRILYGAGHIRRYALMSVMSGFAHLLLAGLFLMILMPSIQYTAVALAFTMAYIVFHLGFVPRIVANVFKTSYGKVLAPLARPLLATVLAAPILLIFMWRISTWNLWWLATAGAAYGVGYAIMVWLIVLTASDRSRLMNSYRLRRT